jgi:superfamily II DNA or RNA helicase
MNKRDQIQKDALTVALNNKRCGLGISMGVGKTLIGLKYINALTGVNTKKGRVLVVAPKLSIFDSWKNDAEKFDIDISNVEFTTYLSLNKFNPQDFDIVVLDECHSLLDSHLSFLGMFAGRILGLTGTPPRYEDSAKGRMVTQFCPIRFKYITDDAVEDDILNDYRIIVHKMSLSSANTLPVKLKDKEFYTSEIKNYNYWTQRVYDANSPKQRQIASIMRMRALMDFKTKETYAKHLLNDIDEKCIVFCNTQDQSDRVCIHSVHSKNPDADENLQDFKQGNIDKLSCVLQLNEGVNIPELRAGIIMHAYGNERKSNQRIGRLLRLNPTETATVHILCYKNTIDDKWVEEALKDLDSNKIKYFDVDESLKR